MEIKLAKGSLHLTGRVDLVVLRAALSYIEETIAHGAITIGVVPPVKESVAIAHDRRRTLAMLKRRKR